MVNVSFHHRRVHPHPLAPRHPFFQGYFHHPLVNLLEHLRSKRRAPAAHRLGVRNLATAHAGKVPVHQVGPHLAFQYLVTPVADMLEDQQTQHHLRRCTAPAPAAALGMSFRQGLVYGCDNVLVRQNRVGVRHPAFAKIADFF
jgi:hypothetical protein